ncbi:TonB-dependent receptor [Sphingomonas sp.]|uniref:TonB-dependent receptor plug domain-containing protein n=1 Tax=Sphingomonas sp. TaxID=28214 RepID=UPI001804970C|nr:TonB-dependent receptor [Sphingomonas sp.]MBA3510370.1 TonB-dependent receptor [Sphingomonas sp.]
MTTAALDHLRDVGIRRQARSCRLLVFCIMISGALAPLPSLSPLHAQGTAKAEVVRTYTSQTFARFAPRTALDMLQLVPGFVIADEEERRGLGALSQNVLINGRAISGKSNDAIDALSRITVSEVLRIEVRASASGEGAGIGRQVANVVVKLADRANGQFSWRPSTRLRDFDPAYFNGDASVSGGSGALGYTIGVRNDALRTGASGPSRILSPEGALIDARGERYFERSDRPRLSADLKYQGPDTLLAGVRGSYQRYYYRFREQSDRSGPELPDRTRFLTQRESDRRYELGGDVDLILGPGRLKLIGLHAAERSPIDTRSITGFDDDSDAIGNRFLRDADERETVLRAEYRWSSGNDDWQVSAERALNRLDNISTFFELLPDGSFEEVEFANASGDVRERRYDAAVRLTRRVSPDLTFRASVGGEISKLEVVGGAGSERTFQRPKGYAAVAWQVNSGLRATAKVERRVGQIRFFDFLASRNLSEDRENAANPDLVPPQSWDVEGELSQDLGALGSTTLRAYGRRIEDLVDQIPIGATAEAPGNLGTAYVYGADWKTSLLLDSLGWSGGRLDGRVQLQNSSVDDPVTGRSRKISNNLVRLLDISLRHDIAGTPWAWGGGLFHDRQAADFRIGETGRYRRGPLSGNLYVENKDVAGLTVRAGVSNLISSGQQLDRFIFVSRRDGPVQSIERRRRSVGPVLSLAVSGNF